MGVHELWSILGPVSESVPLYSLRGKTLAVDLSLWVCEAQHVQAMVGKVTKPHLRNLFFRVSSLTLMGVKLVFVMEGEAPKLKAETMRKRTQLRFGGFKKAAPKSTNTKSSSRGRFKAVLRECADMLDSLGVPWVTAAGEAEAMCAYLDSQGLVDGCITNDGDAFLYGAQTVYRNFNMNTKDPQVDCYRVSRVQTELHLSREDLVGLAVLLGCDYIPKGIPGVGKEQALKLIQTLNGQTLLQRFVQWKESAGVSEVVVKKVPHCHVCRHPGSAKAHERSGCVRCDSKRFCQPQDFDYQCSCDWHCYEQTRQASSAEANIRKRTLASEQFPFTEIIHEFLISKDKPVSHFRLRKPNMLLIQKFAYDKMEWPKHYTSEKVLVLMTYTELMNRKYGREASSQIKPLRILKPRVRNSVACFEVVWRTPEHYAFPEDQPAENQDEVRTVEEVSLFRLAYPEVVEHYLRDKALAEENKTKKKKPKSKKEKPSDPCDGVSDLLAQMTLQTSTSTNANAQLPLPAISNTDTPEVVVLDSPVPLKHHLVLSGDHSGLGECPKGKEPVPPLSHPSCGTNTESGVAASPSVSAVIDALHLSDIDWEASLTSSPPPPAAVNHATEPKPSRTTDDHVTERGPKNAPQKTSTDVRRAESKPAPELCYAECPLRERVLMRNMAASKNRMEAHKNQVTKQLHYKLASLKPISSYHQEPQPSGQIPIRRSSDTESSGKERVNRKEPLIDIGQSVTSKAEAANHSLKHVMPLAPAQSRANDAGTRKPPPKYKFVKAAIYSSSAPSYQRCHSDPGQGDRKDRKLHPATKRSVCVDVYSSSEDSDAENQQLGTRVKAQIKPQNKARGVYLKDASLKPTSRRPTATATLNAARTTRLLVPTARSPRVDVEVNGSPASTKGKCQDVPAVGVGGDVFPSSPASPVAASDSDDSVVCSESLLPLAERLRLKFLRMGMKS